VTVSQISWISWRWWLMNRNVTPCSFSPRMRSNSRVMAAASSWAVGSSRMMNRAPNDSARAISTNCRSSTPSSRAGSRGSTSTAHSASTAAASRRSRRQLIRPVGPRWWRLRNRFSATVSSGMTVERW
jgi:hypothetical protein